MADRPAVPKCGAKRASEPGETCKLPAGYGTGHPGVGPCKWHFGSTPTLEGKHARERIRDAALRHAINYQLDLDHLTPIQCLKEELVRTYMMVAWLEEQTDTEMAMWPDWQMVLLNERKHLVGLAAIMIKAGVEERQVRILESQAEIMADAVRTILDRLVLSPEQLRRAPVIVREVFGALPSARVN